MVTGNPKINQDVNTKLAKSKSGPPFQRAIVVEVIGDSTAKGTFFHSISRDKSDPRAPYDLQGNIAYYLNAPRNSIVASPVSNTEKFNSELAASILQKMQTIHTQIEKTIYR